MIIAMRESTTRRRGGWRFTGTSYLTSTGASGSYAVAADDAAALVVLTGSALGAGTFLAWVQDGAVANTIVMRAYAASGNAYATLRLSSTTVVGDFRDDASVQTSVSISNTSKFGADVWTLCAVTFSPGASDVVRAYCADITPGNGTDATPGTYGAGGSVYLFATNDNLSRLSGKVRSPAIFDRVISDAEFAELHALGPTHDLRVASGNYTGAGPVHWWPADGDSGTTVTDRGSVGGCNLTLNGGVTIEEA